MVAPIVEYHYEAKNDISKIPLFFKIKVPHYVTRKDLKSIQVRHEDIHNGVPFTQLPTRNSYFLVDDKYITIYTRRFSKFICKSCNNVCKRRGKALIFGRVTPRKTIEYTAALRLYICSPLHNISDYKNMSAIL